MGILADRVKELREGLGLSQSELAQRAQMTQQAIQAIEKGKVERPTRIRELARALQSRPEYLLGEPGAPAGDTPRPELSEPIPVPPGRLPYGGKVSAGYFLEVDEFNQELEHFQVPPSIPRHPGYPNLQQSAYRAVGDSMNEVGIFDGMWVVAASYLDWVDKIGELDNGNYVIVQRTRAGGSQLERTVKEVQFARRGMRLIPRSTNPVHKEFFIDLDVDADPDKETVSIIGVVLWFGSDVDPRSKRA